MANATLSVNSKYNNKGQKEAEKGMAKLADTVKGVAAKFLTFQVAKKVFNEINKAVGECNKAYETMLEEQTKATGQITLIQEKMKSFDETANKLKTSFGEIFTNIKTEALAALQPHLDNITKWVDENGDNIVAVIISIPQIIKSVLGIIKNMVTASGEDNINIIQRIGGFIHDFFPAVFKSLLTVIFNLIKAVGTTIWEPLKTGFQIISDAIRNIFNTVINFIIDRINNVISLINKIINNPVTQKLFGMDSSNEIKLLSNIEAPEKQDREVNTNAIVDAWKTVGTSFNGFLTTFLDTGKSALEENFGDIGSQIRDSVRDIVNSNKGLVQANKTIVATIKEAENELEEKPAEKEKKSNSFGEIGKAVEGFKLGGIIGLLSSMSEAFLKPLMAIENVAKVFNFMTTIFEKMFAVLEPLINQLLAPIVVILEIIGEMLGTIFMPFFQLFIALLEPFLNIFVTIFKVLQPIISSLAKILGLIIMINPLLEVLAVVFTVVGNVIAFLFNYILRPIINFFGNLFVGVYNLIISIWNAIVRVLKSINIFGWKPFSGLKEKQKETWTNIEKVDPNGTDYSAMPGSQEGYSGGGSSSGSYSAAKDVIVNISFNHSYVNGDARDIALMIEKELESAHALGY